MSSCGPLEKSTQDALLAASLSEARAALIYEQGQEAVVFALLTLTKRLAEAQAVGNSRDAFGHDSDLRKTAREKPRQETPWGDETLRAALPRLMLHGVPFRVREFPVSVKQPSASAVA